MKKTSLYFLLIRRYLCSRHKHRVRLECSGFLSVMSQSINQSGRVGSDRVGSGRIGSDRVGSGRVGSGRVWRFARANPALLLHSSRSVIAFFTSSTCKLTSSNSWSRSVLFGPPSSVFHVWGSREEVHWPFHSYCQKKRPVYLVVSKHPSRSWQLSFVESVSRYCAKFTLYHKLYFRRLNDREFW